MSAGARSPPQPANLATAARPPLQRASAPRTSQRGERELGGLADPLALRLNASRAAPGAASAAAATASASTSSLHSPSHALYSSHDPASYRRWREASPGAARADGAVDGDGRGVAGAAAPTPVREGDGPRGSDYRVLGLGRSV